MEKISSILPNTTRSGPTDIRAAPPVRPGMPAFGRSIGTSTPNVSTLASTAEKAVAIHRDMLDKKLTRNKPELVAQEISDQFFMHKALNKEAPDGLPNQQPRDIPSSRLNTRFDSQGLDPNESRLEFASSPKTQPRVDSRLDSRGSDSLNAEDTDGLLDDDNQSYLEVAHIYDPMDPPGSHLDVRV